jgi:hypothetical protein
VQVEAALAPGAGNDERLHEVALHAVEVGRLVVLVQQTKRHQEQPGAHRDGLIELAVDVELLDLEFPDVIGGGHRMLDLVLGIELGAIIEPVADAEYRAGQIRLGLRTIVYRMGVVDLPVAPQSQPGARRAE